MNRTTYCWWALLASTIAQMCAALSTQGIGVFSGFLKYDFNLSNSEVGILASTLNIAPILGLFFVGKILDYVGEQLPIFLGMIIIGFAMLFISFATQYWMLLIIMFFCGVGYSPIQPGGSKAIYTWFNPNRRGLAMGIRQAALPLGGAFAAIIFPYIIHYYDWRHAAMAAAILIITGGMFFFLIYRNAPSNIVKKKLSSQQMLWIMCQNQFLKIAQVGIVLVAIQTCILIFWMLFIHQQFDFPLIKCAWYLFAIQISGAIGRVVLSVRGNAIVDGYRQILRITIFLLIILIVIIMLLPITSPPWVIMLISCVLGFFCFGWYGPWIVWLSESSSNENIGATLSVSMTLNQVAIVVAPTLFGVVLDITGSYTVPWICLAAIASFLLLFWNKTYVD